VVVSPPERVDGPRPLGVARATSRSGQHVTAPAAERTTRREAPAEGVERLGVSPTRKGEPGTSTPMPSPDAEPEELRPAPSASPPLRCARRPGRARPTRRPRAGVPENGCGSRRSRGAGGARPHRPARSAGQSRAAGAAGTAAWGVPPDSGALAFRLSTRAAGAVSSPLAIGAVSAVLRNLLDNRFIDVGTGPVKVTAVAPDLIKLDDPEAPPSLNLFLWRVTRNQGWANAALPAFDGNGTRLTNTPLALDLHYLLTAYGVSDFQAEILLGYAMHLLHERPVLDRAAIRRALGPSSLGPTILPPAFQALTASDLADQGDAITITD